MDRPSSRLSAIYHPLDGARKQFRILHLQASENVDDELHCSLEISSFVEEPSPEYEAISYCWGEVPGFALIFVDGSQHTAPASAVKALKRFRWPRETRKLCIDAICIDQDNVSDKEQQIPLMGRIFSSSKGTLVWLGDEDEDTLVAFKTVEHLSMREGAEHVLRRETTPASFDDPIPPGDSLDAVSHLLTRSWFRRTWIIQEVALAPRSTFHCGPHQIDGDCLSRFLNWTMSASGGTNKYSRALDIGLVCLSQILNVLGRSAPNGRTSLGWLLIFSLPFGASEPRDKVFGILGLLKPSANTNALLEVDYNKSCNDVFRDATRAAIIGGDFRVLECNQLPSEADDLLRNWVDNPADGDRSAAGTTKVLSWVPRWDISHRRGISMSRARKFEILPRRFARMDLILHPRQPSHLELRGFWLDDIAEILSTLSVESDEDAAIYNGHVIKFLSSCMANLKSYVGNAEHWLPFIRDLLSDYGTHDPRNLAEAKVRKILRDQSWHNSVFDPQKRDDDVLMDLAVEQQQQAIALLLYVAWSRCRNGAVFLTKKGRIGIGPILISPGDIITGVYGARYPWVMRTLDDGTSDTLDDEQRRRVRLLGPCKVGHFLKGNLMELIQAEGLAETTFEIE